MIHLADDVDLDSCFKYPYWFLTNSWVLKFSKRPVRPLINEFKTADSKPVPVIFHRKRGSYILPHWGEYKYC